MHNLIKLPVFLLTPLLLFGCSQKVRISEIDKSYKTPSQTVTATVPQISGLKNSGFEDKINKEFMVTTDNLLEKFSTSAKETGENSEFSNETTVHYNKNGFLSIVTDYCYFARSAHKSAFRTAKNIDVENCSEISLSNLFSDDSYIDVLNSMLEEVVSNNTEKYQDLWEKPKISHDQRFFISEKNLVLFYPPYELSYYERGFVEIPLPIEDILTYLKPEYREIFSN